MPAANTRRRGSRNPVTNGCEPWKLKSGCIQAMIGSVLPYFQNCLYRPDNPRSYSWWTWAPSQYLVNTPSDLRALQQNSMSSKPALEKTGSNSNCPTADVSTLKLHVHAYKSTPGWSSQRHRPFKFPKWS